MMHHQCGLLLLLALAVYADTSHNYSPPIINATTLDLQENEICKTRGEKMWVCKSQNACPHVRGDPQTVCSFQGKLPIVCCPPLRRPREIKIKKVTDPEFTSP